MRKMKKEEKLKLRE